MPKKTYSEKLKDPRWQKKRLEILNRDNWTCQSCGDKETTLHVHHVSYRGEPWEAPDDAMYCYCEECHDISHKKKKLAPFERKLIDITLDDFFYLEFPYEKMEKQDLIKLLKLNERRKIATRKKIFQLLNNG